MTTRHWYEYILKGLFVGLWVFVALQVPADPAAARTDIAWVVGWVLAGLAVAVVAASVLHVSRGLRPAQNWVAFPLFVLLESPTFVYAGVLGGLVVGVLSGAPGAEPWATKLAGAFGLTFDQIRHTPPAGDWLGYCAAGGALFGFALYQFRRMDDPTRRFWVGMAVAVALAYLAGEYVGKIPNPASTADPPEKLFATPDARFNLGLYLLLGLPFFYLLVFCADAEESDAENMAVCALLGAGLQLLGMTSTAFGGGFTVYLVVALVYFIYGTRVMPGLRVFKHVLRGFAYLNLGRLRLSLGFFRRAQELDPENQLAAQGMLALHESITPAKIDRDPGLVDELDFTLCLDRAQRLLSQPPTPAQRAEAGRFLELVEQKKPAYLAKVDYLRVVALMHAKEYDAAADTLSRLLNPETPGYHPVVRKKTLYDAWDLALRVHPRLVERLGWDELNKPGRRMEAIGAVERKLAAEPENPAAKEYRTILYAQLTEGEFIAAAAAGLPKDFAYEYVEQLGLALADDPDPDRRERGAGYLRIAARGLPDRGPGIYMKLAQVYEKRGDAEDVRKCLETAKQVGLAVGPRNLYKDQRAFYFDALKRLADLADQRGDPEAAIAELRQYQEDGGPAVLETYRKLADLHGKLAKLTGDNKEALNALLMTENGLAYDSTDADLLKKKDTFYYSVEPEQVERVKDKVKKWFDVKYCVRKAMSVLNAKDGGVELLDWATHLARLARVMQPDGNGVRLVEARLLLRRGERDAGLKLLEDIHYDGQRGSGEEEEAWYTATKLLGQLYLEELNKPENALHCYLKFKDYHKSGADTLYQIARCYEAMNDTPHAVQFYNAVTAYEGHSLYWDAKDALRRLGKG
jgi:tetratricopeptide (TPR) repeat protein